MGNVSKKDLTKFEEEIKTLFLDKRIKSPIHLSGGNEDALIRIFKRIKRDDWVFSTHRSHYHALLKGIGSEWLKNEILENRSIHIYNREYHFFSSAIVGGCLPIAVGVAMAIKRREGKRHIWVFLGDMASHTGIFHECTEYAARHQLPITWVIEDNHFSVNTPTEEVWGTGNAKPHIVKYSYQRIFPHAGVDQFVKF